jgi:hypothetical protein
MIAGHTIRRTPTNESTKNQQKRMKTKSTMSIKPIFLLALAVGFLGSKAPAQDSAWGPATGITGDANLSTSGFYLDAFIPNTSLASPLTADGITFNVDSIISSTAESDGIDISLAVTSGSLNNYNGGSFPSTAPSSPAFAAIMNAGGTYENGGAGAGTVTLSGLTAGQKYSVQVFNYVSDGDAGLTTLSGSTPVTLSNLPGAAGPNTYGEFATGTFTATGSSETFNWNGAGSGFTVLGAIYISTLPANQPPTISQDTTPSSAVAYLNTTTTLSANFSGTAPISNQWFISTNGGLTFNGVPGATNNALTVTNSQVVTNIEYYLQAENAYGTNHSSPASLTVVSTPPQTITWGPATGITGDNSLLTNGTYVDAILPNALAASSLAVDGITFNALTSSSGTGGSDGIISYDIISGNNNTYSFTTFPTNTPSSPAFAAVMNAGGTYENGGSGSGLVTIGGLTLGHNYTVQVFNYANDGDPGLTTLSGTNAVTLSNLPNSGGAGTYGEYATGTFKATSTNESFFWNGAGSSYTVLGSISVLDISGNTAPILSQDTTPLSVNALLNSTTTFMASFIGPQPITYQWRVSTNGGSTFTSIPGATNNALTLTNSMLVTNVEYYLVAANTYGTNHSTTATLTVIPAPVQNIAWGSATPITGDANLLTNGVYFDAFIPLLPSPLTADGVTFNAPTGSDTDGKISYVVTSGADIRYDNNAPFTGGSSQFNAIMNAGGTFENGGAGAGTVTISSLTPGHTYSVQIFDYAGDGDAGLTTFSGSTPVTLTTTGSGATGGSFATGTFTATNVPESFNWNGSGSAYTVVGAISVFDVTPPVSTTPVTLIAGKNNGQIQLSWPADHTGWRLQMQTNPLKTGLGTNWVDVSGSTSVDTTNIPVDITNGSVFFRLVYP